MKRVFLFIGRMIGFYIFAIIVVGFFPTQISTCDQLLSSYFYRISAWFPLMGTICRYLEIAWNWVLQYLPHFGTMCGVIISTYLVRSVIKKIKEL